MDMKENQLKKKISKDDSFTDFRLASLRRKSLTGVEHAQDPILYRVVSIDLVAHQNSNDDEDSDLVEEPEGWFAGTTVLT